MLHELGYANVRDYRGGIADWVASGGPLENVATVAYWPTVGAAPQIVTFRARLLGTCVDGIERVLTRRRLARKPVDRAPVFGISRARNSTRRVLAYHAQLLRDAAR